MKNGRSQDKTLKNTDEEQTPKSQIEAATNDPQRVDEEDGDSRSQEDDTEETLGEASLMQVSESAENHDGPKHGEADV